jgi:hypothetical protein
MAQATGKQIEFISKLVEQKRNISDPFSKRFWTAVEANTETLTSFEASVIIDWLKSGSSTYERHECVKTFMGAVAWAIKIVRISAKTDSVANEILDNLGNRLVEFVASISVPEGRDFWILSVNDLREAVEKFTAETQPETITVNETKRLVRDSGYIVKDTSGSTSYGYSFAIFKTEQVIEPIVYTRAVGEPLATSHNVYEPETINKAGSKGAIRAVFNRSDVEALIND